MKGIVLFGHGARNPEWAQPFHRIRDAILQREPEALVEPGFLELMRPTFDEGVACLVEQGATAITVVPIFMAARDKGQDGNGGPEVVGVTRQQPGVEDAAAVGVAGGRGRAGVGGDGRLCDGCPGLKSALRQAVYCRRR